jgi:hypothetical protein
MSGAPFEERRRFAGRLVSKDASLIGNLAAQQALLQRRKGRNKLNELNRD